MILLLIRKDSYPIEFIKYILKSFFWTLFLTVLNTKKLEIIENTIQKREADKKFNLLAVCKLAIDKSLLIVDNSSVTIKISSELHYNDYKVENVIRLLTYGDLEVLPYPIFLEVSSYIKKNISKLYKMYLMGILL